MSLIKLENLTPRQREAFVLRFYRRWHLRRIAVKLGITVSSAGELVKRAQFRAGLGRNRTRIIKTQPRRVRTESLSIWATDV